MGWNDPPNSIPQLGRYTLTTVISPRTFSTQCNSLVAPYKHSESTFTRLAHSSPTSLEWIDSGWWRVRSELLSEVQLVQSPEVIATRRCGLSSLILPDGVFSPPLFSHINYATRQSHSTVTSLCLARCGATQDEWNAVFSNWAFPQLSRPTVENMNVSIPTLIAFMTRHPSLDTV